MKKEIAKKWIAALKSGKYNQGVEVLHRIEGSEDTYCCLGVLCALYQQDRRKKKKKMLDVEDKWGTITYDDEDTHLPCAVREWAGMNTDDGSWDVGERNLIYLNDIKGNNFKIIAKVIEEQMENL